MEGGDGGLKLQHNLFSMVTPSGVVQLSMAANSR